MLHIFNLHHISRATMEFPHKNFLNFITFLVYITSINSKLFSAFASNNNCDPTSAFIKSECNATRFPSTCTTTLGPFACKIKPGDQPELCRVALNASVGTSQNALQTLLNIVQENGVKGNTTETGVISDCINTYITLIDYVMMASQMMNTRVISESSLVNLKLQISGLMDSVADWEGRCLKNVDRQHIRDSLKKRIFVVVNPCIKLNKIISTLVNRIHISE